MSVAFDHRDPGTAEELWGADGFDAAPVSLPQRLIVFAAHPDDETLGAGGLIATAAAAGADISVVVATDGEASDSADPGLGARRRRELVTALAHLAPRARIRFLGYPDGGLRERAADLTADIEAELSGTDPVSTLVATTWWGDGHRDHRVLGEATLAAAGGREVLGYPIWYWHWGDPTAIAAGPWRALTLEPDARQAKAAALAAHVSQTEGTEPILHERMLAHFRRPAELFVSASDRTDGSVPPEQFDAFMRRHDDPWGFESRWYERRKRAILLASLPQERFARGLELGCATGILTAELAVRCDRVVAVDASADAVQRAQARVPDAEVTRLTLPGQWPAGSFDLIVLSEIAYYWSREDLALALQRVSDALTPDGVLVACHWRGRIDGAPLDGGAVHAALAGLGRSRVVGHVEDDFLLDVWAPAGAASVADREGLR